MFLSSLFNGLTTSHKAGSFVEFSTTSEDYFHEKANVVSPINRQQKGRVQLHGVYWFARLSNLSDETIQAGSSVAVVDREDNTLIVVLAS